MFLNPLNVVGPTTWYIRSISQLTVANSAGIFLTLILNDFIHMITVNLTVAPLKINHLGLDINKYLSKDGSD